MANMNKLNDPRFINLTLFTFSLVDSLGINRTIPSQGLEATWHYPAPEGQSNWMMKGPDGVLLINEKRLHPDDTHATAIVTETVGNFLAVPNNRNLWMGRVVGPKGFKGSKDEHVATTDWVMYKDVTPVPQPVVFNFDMSKPAFSLL